MTETAGRESGFTLLELMVTMALLTSVMAGVFAVLESQSRTERRVQIYADNQELLRQAVVAMQRDIRSSEPLKKLTTPPEYALRIELDVYEDITDPAPVPVRWIVDTANRQLRREIVNPGNAPPTVTYRLTGVSNSYGVPLFTFYSANSGVAGSNPSLVDPGKYDLADPLLSPADVAACAVRIRIELLAAPTPGPDPAKLVSDAQLRNRLPGGTGCPTLSLAPNP